MIASTLCVEQEDYNNLSNFDGKNLCRQNSFFFLFALLNSCQIFFNGHQARKRKPLLQENGGYLQSAVFHVALIFRPDAL